jgi:hypothetical protein
VRSLRIRLLRMVPKTRIEPYAFVMYRAHCRCGWRGPAQHHRSMAKLTGADHFAERATAWNVDTHA